MFVTEQRAATTCAQQRSQQSHGRYQGNYLVYKNAKLTIWLACRQMHLSAERLWTSSASPTHWHSFPLHNTMGMRHLSCLVTTNLSRQLLCPLVATPQQDLNDLENFQEKQPDKFNDSGELSLFEGNAIKAWDILLDQLLLPILDARIIKELIKVCYMCVSHASIDTFSRTMGENGHACWVSS